MLHNSDTFAIRVSLCRANRKFGVSLLFRVNEKTGSFLRHMMVCNWSLVARRVTVGWGDGAALGCVVGTGLGAGVGVMDGDGDGMPIFSRLYLRACELQNERTFSMGTSVLSLFLRVTA